MIHGAGGSRTRVVRADFRAPLASYRWGARIVPTPIHGLEKGDYMKRRPVSWRIGALSSVVALVVIVLGAGAGAVCTSEALGDNARRRDDGLDHEHRSRGFVRLRDVHAREQRLRAPARLPARAEAGAVARHEVLLGREPDDVALHPSQGRHVQRRLGVRLGGREVLLRPRDEQDDREGGRCEHAVVVARKPQERHDERQVRGHVPPQVTAGHVAVHPGDAGGFIVPSDTYEPNHLRGNTESQIGTGPYMLTKYSPGQQAVFTRNDELLEHAGEGGQPDHPVLLEVVDDEARDPARRDRHVVPVVHTDRDHVAPEAEGASRLQRAPAGASATSTMNVTRPPANNIAVRRAVAYLMPRQSIAAGSTTAR